VDLFQFEKLNNIPFLNFSVTLINGGTNDQDPATAGNGEANLDVQTIVGISNSLPIIKYITGGSPPFIPNLNSPTPADNFNELYLSYYQFLLSQPNSALPQVISNSYDDNEQTVPPAYAARVCNMIGMLGLRGITVLECTGDSGVGGACQPNDGKKTPQLTPTFPASCPYVLAVGGAQAVTSEVAWNSSSGGFSNYFHRPAYQPPTVPNYLNSHINPETKKLLSRSRISTGEGFLISPRIV
jgi:tripeptidyl-peptidase I